MSALCWCVRHCCCKECWSCRPDKAGMALVTACTVNKKITEIKIKPKNRLPLLKCAYLLIGKTGTQALMECPGLQISCITCSLSSHVSTQLSSEQSRVIQETKKIVLKKFFLLSQCKLYKAE